MNKLVNINYKESNLSIDSHFRIHKFSNKRKEVVSFLYFIDSFTETEKQWLTKNNFSNWIEQVISNYIFKPQIKNKKDHICITGIAKFKLIKILISYEIYENKIVITTKSISNRNLFFKLSIGMVFNKFSIDKNNLKINNNSIYKKYNESISLNNSQINLQSSMEQVDLNKKELIICHPELNKKNKRLYQIRSNRLENNYNTTIIYF